MTALGWIVVFVVGSWAIAVAAVVLVIANQIDEQDC